MGHSSSVKPLVWQSKSFHLSTEPAKASADAHLIIFTLSLTTPYKRSHSPFHLLLRTWSCPSLPSRGCCPSCECMCAYWLAFSLCISSKEELKALLLSFKSPLLLPSVPLTAKDLFSHGSLLGWPEAAFSKCAVRRVLIVCLSTLYLSFCPYLVLRGLSFSKAVRQRFVVLTLSAFLCVFSSWLSPRLCRGAGGL